MTAEPELCQTPELTGRLTSIVAAALSILESEGLAAVTMRRVAAAVGIQAPSLYKHVKDKDVILGLLQRHAMVEFGRAVGAAGPGGRQVAAAYRQWALANPSLYELAARRPVRRDIVGETEAFAAAPLVRAVGGDPDKARAFLGVAHGLADLELNAHFPAGADIEAAWNVAVDALVVGTGGGSRDPRRDTKKPPAHERGRDLAADETISTTT